METRQDYRERLCRLLLCYGYEPVDPWQREKVLYCGPSEEWWRNVPSKGFIQRDLDDIEKCDILVAYLPKVSAGTCMELFYARSKGKKTVTICRIRNPSPWIIAYSDIILKSLKEFDELLQRGL
ncbi:MAG: nucleoside 2-deoxyribosyltransferase [archaeon]|nr:nucleoside 2-deoxyribosyltransferase [archaeon]